MLLDAVALLFAEQMDGCQQSCCRCVADVQVETYGPNDSTESARLRKEVHEAACIRAVTSIPRYAHASWLSPHVGSHVYGAYPTSVPLNSCRCPPKGGLVAQ